ncbi:MAG: hypothetical protein C0592_13840 [Marinilabiliales bacterium]|nr:MAG: hypothetical protein C0592_13840 [Marinilabiliales bacterium]
MKKILIILFIAVLAINAGAQNPLIDLSYPWLYPGYVKENKIKTVVLGTMDSNNETQIRQIVLYFDEAGNAVKEESRIGFLYTMSLHSQTDQKSVWLFESDGQTDTITYLKNTDENSIDRYVATKGLNGQSLQKTTYQYDELGMLQLVVDYDEVVITDGNYNAIEWAVLDSVSVSYNGTEMTMGNEEYRHKMIYDEKGRIQLLHSENFSYGISEETSYQWDIKGMLLMIEWTQEGSSEKTFVTYTYYE